MLLRVALVWCSFRLVPCVAVQAKAQKKAEDMSKKGSQREDQKKGLKLICPACKVGDAGEPRAQGGLV